MAIPSQELTFISLCSGAGGGDLALKLALPGARCVLYVEREIACVNVLVSHIQKGWLDDAPIFSDLTQCDFRPFSGRVGGIIGSPPCQSASGAGKRKGASDERWLWGHAIRAVREVSPEFFFFENVAGLVAGKLQVELEKILDQLQGLDYQIALGLWTASESAQAPHKRERVFILGCRPGFDLWGHLGAQDGYLEDALSEHRQRRGESRDVAQTGGGIAGSSYQWERGGNAPDCPVGDCDQLPLWPPRPDDLAGWEFVLSRWPWLAPAVDPEFPGGLGDTECSGWDGLPLGQQQGYVEAHPGESGTGSTPRIAQQGKEEGQIKEETVSPFCRLADGLAPLLEQGYKGERTDRLRAGGNGLCPIQGAYALIVLADALRHG